MENVLTPARMVMAAPKPLNSFPFQRTSNELDWAVFMYIFVFVLFVGTVLLGRIFTCCMERSDKDDMLV